MTHANAPLEPVTELERYLCEVERLATTHGLALSVRNLVAPVDEKRKFAPDALVARVDEALESISLRRRQLAERLTHAIRTWIRTAEELGSYV